MNHSTIYPSKHGCPIDLTDANGQAVQIFIHSPSRFICANRQRVLPDWQLSTSVWVVIVLQQSQCELVEINPEVEGTKQRLRERFMRFGCDVAFNLRDRNYLTDIIDPRTGYPLLSRPGQLPHDDTAVVQALLGYPILENNCRVLIHPQWGMAVYPSILMSTAPPIMIEFVLRSIAPLHGWRNGD